MALKVIFSGDTKQIHVKPGVTEIDVKLDLYSDWKEWVLESSNAKYESAFRTFGGDPTIAGQYAPSYFFLMNNWKVVVNNDEDISFGVNLYSDDGSTPFIVGSGSSVTNRNSDAVTVDTGVAQSLDYAGVIHINPSIGVAGTTYPIGTIAMPVNNISDAKIIASQRGIDYFETYGTVVINENLNDVILHGGKYTDIIVFQSINVSGSTFKECILTGSYDGFIAAQTCQLYDGLTGMNGVFENCGISGKLYFDSNVNTSILDCSSMIPGGSSSPSLFLNENVNLSFRKYSGGLNVYDCQSGSSVSLEFMAGNCRLLSGNTSGDIVIRGIASLTNQTSGTTIDISGLLIPMNVATQHSQNVQTEIMKNI